MPYIYQADILCDDCGSALAEELESGGYRDNGDSDEFPQEAAEEPTDSPNHCAQRENCLAAIDLGDYGFKDSDPLIGAESRRIGALCGEELTSEGVSYLKEILEDPKELTPYQSALHLLWVEVFSGYLGSDYISEIALRRFVQEEQRRHREERGQ